MRKIYHLVSVFVLAFSFSLFFWFYDFTFDRFIFSVLDLAGAAALWWKVSISGDIPYNTEVFEPRYDFFAAFDYIRVDVPAWVSKFKELPAAIFNWENFKIFLLWFIIKLLQVLVIYCVIYTVLTVIGILLDINLTSMSDKPSVDTFLLKVYKKIEVFFAKILAVIIDYVVSFRYSWYWTVFVIIWLFNLNIASIIIEFVSFVFGFPVAANFDSFYTWIGMLISDIVVALSSAPFIVWLVIFYVIFSKLRLARAYKVLNHLYNYDVGFLKSCAYNVLLDGPTGASKTKTVVQMSIMTQDYYHTDQWESMYKYYQEFPEFPFYLFEQDLKSKLEEGVITNMHTARNYIKCLECEVLKDPSAERLYNYSGPMCYNDGVRYVPIWEMLDSYAQLYYMYRNDTSSIISNLSIRSDLRMLPGHFPIWDNNLLRRTPEYLEQFSQYCHILDINMLRFNKYVGDKPSDVHQEYGINVYTELDKDQGNQFTNKVYDIKDDEANPLNDGYELYLMLERHLGTVDYKCYIRNFADIQREGTLREGVKGLYDELNITDKAEPHLALPFFVEGWLYDKIDAWLSDFTLEVKSCGTVHTLPYYILRRILFPLGNLVRRIKQKFTFEELELTIKNACSPEGVYKKHKFIVLWCIAHSYLYSTDCYAAINDEAAKYSVGGIQDIPTYNSIKPELHELRLQNSYFSNKQLARLERIKKRNK